MNFYLNKNITKKVSLSVYYEYNSIGIVYNEYHIIKQYNKKW